MMRILHVVHGLAIGGLESGVVKLVNGLPFPQFEQAVCCLDRLGELAERITGHVPMWDLGRRPHDWSVAIKLSRIMREWQPNLVHCRNWNAWPDTVLGCWLSRRGPVLVWSFHGFAEPQPLPVRRRIASRALAMWTDRLAAVSRDAAEHYAALSGIAPQSFEILHNGVDGDQFRPSLDRVALRRENQLPAHGLIVVTVANLTAVKNHALLLQAADRMRRADGCRPLFLLLGDGPERSRLQALSRDLGLADQIIFCGDRLPVERLLPAADLFVLPSLNEGFSNALLEAMACGVPVVATAVGSNTELVTHGRTGYLCPPHDPNALADAMASLLCDSSRRAVMGREARKNAIKHFSLAAMLQRYGAFYEDCMAPSGRARRLRNPTAPTRVDEPSSSSVNVEVGPGNPWPGSP